MTTSERKTIIQALSLARAKTADLLTVVAMKLEYEQEIIQDEKRH